MGNGWLHGGPLIVPPDVLIKWDCSERRRRRKKRSAADARRRRSALGLWEYGCPGVPQMKTHFQTKRAQYPEEVPAR